MENKTIGIESIRIVLHTIILLIINSNPAKFSKRRKYEYHILNSNNLLPNILKSLIY